MVNITRTTTGEFSALCEQHWQRYSYICLDLYKYCFSLSQSPSEEPASFAPTSSAFRWLELFGLSVGEETSSVGELLPPARCQQDHGRAHSWVKKEKEMKYSKIPTIRRMGLRGNRS